MPGGQRRCTRYVMRALPVVSAEALLSASEGLPLGVYMFDHVQELRTQIAELRPQHERSAIRH